MVAAETNWKICITEYQTVDKSKLFDKKLQQKPFLRKSQITKDKGSQKDSKTFYSTTTNFFCAIKTISEIMKIIFKIIKIFSKFIKKKSKTIRKPFKLVPRIIYTPLILFPRLQKPYLRPLKSFQSLSKNKSQKF